MFRRANNVGGERGRKAKSGYIYSKPDRMCKHGRLFFERSQHMNVQLPSISRFEEKTGRYSQQHQLQSIQWKTQVLQYTGRGYTNSRTANSIGSGLLDFGRTNQSPPHIAVCTAFGNVVGLITLDVRGKKQGGRYLYPKS
jgi:hypothetical protein